MQIAKKLTSGQVSVLSSGYSLVALLQEKKTETISGSGFIRNIAEISPMKHYDLVFYHLKELDKKHLSRINPNALNSILGKPYYGLTDLGYAFCQFMDKYDEI